MDSHPIYLKYYLMWFSPLCLGLFSWGFPTKIVCIFHISFKLSFRPRRNHRSSVNNNWKSLIIYFFQSFVSSSFLSPCDFASVSYSFRDISDWFLFEETILKKTCGHGRWRNNVLKRITLLGVCHLTMKQVFLRNKYDSDEIKIAYKECSKRNFVSAGRLLKSKTRVYD